MVEIQVGDRVRLRESGEDGTVVGNCPPWADQGGVDVMLDGSRGLVCTHKSSLTKLITPEHLEEMRSIQHSMAHARNAWIRGKW